MIPLPLTNALHGAANLGGNPEELAEIPARHLHHTVIQTGLKVGCRGVCHRVPTEKYIYRFHFIFSFLPQYELLFSVQTLTSADTSVLKPYENFILSSNLTALLCLLIYL